MLCLYVGMVVFNTLPWTRAEVVTVPAKGTSWIGQQWTANGHEYVIGMSIHTSFLVKRYIANMELDIVRDVPGLGAAGYVAHSQDFIATADDNGAKGKQGLVTSVRAYLFI